MLRLLERKRRPRTEREHCTCGRTATMRINGHGVCSRQSCIDIALKVTGQAVIAAYRRQFGGAA